MDVNALLNDLDKEVELAQKNKDYAQANGSTQHQIEAKREWKTWVAARALVRKAAGIEGTAPDKDTPR